MGKYALHRVFQMFPLLVLVSVLAFSLLKSMPGDPLDRMLEDNPDFTYEDYVRLRAIYGLDDPFYVAYFKWASQVVQGNLGYSRQYKIPVLQLVGPRLQNTLVLTTLAFVIAITAALTLGIISAVKQYSVVDYASMALTFVGSSLPGFWLGLMLIILFSVQLHWLPPGGIMSSDVGPSFWERGLDRGKYLIMPVFITAFEEMTSWARYTRNTLLDVLQLDRVNHGFRAYTSKKVMDKVVKKNLTLCLCPTSNLSVKFIKDMDHMKEVIQTLLGPVDNGNRTSLRFSPMNRIFAPPTQKQIRDAQASAVPDVSSNAPSMVLAADNPSPATARAGSAASASVYWRAACA